MEDIWLLLRFRCVTFVKWRRLSKSSRRASLTVKLFRLDSSDKLSKIRFGIPFIKRWVRFVNILEFKASNANRFTQFSICTRETEGAFWIPSREVISKQFLITICLMSLVNYNRFVIESLSSKMNVLTSKFLSYISNII